MSCAHQHHFSVMAKEIVLRVHSESGGFTILAPCAIKCSSFLTNCRSDEF